MDGLWRHRSSWLQPKTLFDANANAHSGVLWRIIEQQLWLLILGVWKQRLQCSLKVHVTVCCSYLGMKLLWTFSSVNDGASGIRADWNLPRSQLWTTGRVTAGTWAQLSRAPQLNPQKHGWTPDWEYVAAFTTRGGQFEDRGFFLCNHILKDDLFWL